MALGPGRYDQLCTRVRELAEAECAIVIIVGGNLGSGFSVQMTNSAYAEKLPDLLESMAKQIRES